MPAKKVRRTVHELVDDGETMFRATCPATGEILECAQLVPLLQQISRNLTADRKSHPGWLITRAV